MVALTIVNFVVSFLWCVSAMPVKTKFKGSPIILVPGDLGSQLTAKLDKRNVVHYLCSKRTKDYFTIWLNLELMVPYILGCWADNIKLIFNETTNTTRNQDGVEIQVPGWGNTSTVEWLDPSQISVGSYFANIVQNAVQWGYTRGVNIRGAPYDFRKAPNEAIDYFERLKQLIEQTYYINGNKKVVVVGHSMGNLYMLYFYNRQDQKWKNKFIRAHVSIGAPWGGAVKTMKLFASGDNLDHYRLLFNPLTLREPQRSFTSTAFLMPSDKFWSPYEILVRTPTKNYTVNDYQMFFKHINYTVGYKAREVTKSLVYDLKPPEIEVRHLTMFHNNKYRCYSGVWKKPKYLTHNPKLFHCLFSSGINTPSMYSYEHGDFPNSQPVTVMGDGDGSVNIRSLSGCIRWKKQQKQPVHWREVKNIEHVAFLRSQDVVNYIKQNVLSPTKSFYREEEFVYY